MTRVPPLCRGRTRHRAKRGDEQKQRAQGDRAAVGRRLQHGPYAAAEQAAVAAGHLRHAGQKGAPAGGHFRKCAGVGGAAFVAAAPVGVGIAGRAPFPRAGSGATARAGIPPTENGDAIRIAPQPQAAWHDVGKLMAEDGVQRFLVVVLAVEQQAFAAVAVAEEARGIHEAHRAGQAGDDVSGAARLRAIREAQAVAGAFIERIAGAKGVHGVHLQFHIFKMAAARRPRGRRCSRSQRRKRRRRQKAHGGAGERSGAQTAPSNACQSTARRTGRALAPAAGGMSAPSAAYARGNRSAGSTRWAAAAATANNGWRPRGPRGAAGARYCAARSAPSGRGKGRRRRGQHSTANIRGKR